MFRDRNSQPTFTSSYKVLINRHLSDKAKLVYFVIQDQQDNLNYADITAKEIGLLLHCTDRAVRNAVAELKEANLIEVEKVGRYKIIK